MASRYQRSVECVNTLLNFSTPCKVAPVTTASSSRTSRGRRSARPSGDERELAILTTAEQLLEQRPIAHISVDALEEEADALASSQFSIGHIALGVALGYIDFRFPELNWREGHPKIAEWHAAFEARPSARANTPVDEP